jgi:3-hydroxybutyryl-CoA dehydrogenase
MSDATRPRLAVLGGGTMGRGIAAAGLRAGMPTVLVDVDTAALSAARDALAHRLSRDLGIVGAEEALGLLRLDAEIESAVADATAVVEAVPEIATLKLDVFSGLARAAPPSALLATNTSTMNIRRLADACDGSPRVIGMHFFNPVHRMALVEIVVPTTASEATVGDALALAGALGKDPIVVTDRPGFVTSRLGLLLGNEAMRMVDEGVASAADIDKAMRLGYRHPMGPLELADLVGLDARLNNVRSMYEQDRREEYRPPAILERLVAHGRHGRKTGTGFYVYDEDGTVIGPAEDLP